MSHIYVVEHPNNLYKVGRSKTPDRRVYEMNIGTPEELMLHSKIDVGSNTRAVAVEGELHDRLSEYNETGEWYSIGESELMDTIDDVVSGDHDRVEVDDTPEYSQTTIAVPCDAKERLKEQKPEGVTWGYYLTEIRTVD